MNRYKGTLILLILVILLGLYLVWIELPAEKARQEEERAAELLLHFKPEEARGLFLQYPREGEGSRILLSKDAEGRWRVQEPMDAEADQEEVEDLVVALSEMKFNRVVEENAEDLSVYGLEPPALRVSVRLADDEQHLQMGDSAPIGAAVYVGRAGERKVHLADQYHKTDLTKTLTDLRKKEFFEFDPQSVIGLDLDYRDRSFLLVRQADSWRVTKPVQRTADGEEVAAVLRTLSRLRAKDFVDDGREEVLARLGHPQVEISLRFSKGDAGTPPLSIYSEPEGGELPGLLIARTGNQERPLFKIDSSVLNDLDKDLFALSDKHLLAFDPAQVVSIQVRKEPEGEFAFERVEGQWKSSGQILAEDEAAKLTDLLQDLRDLKAVDLVSEKSDALKPLGLHAPRFEVILLDGEQKTLANLMIGDELDGLYYARSDRSEAVYMIRDEISASVPMNSPRPALIELPPDS